MARGSTAPKGSAPGSSSTRKLSISPPMSSGEKLPLEAGEEPPGDPHLLVLAEREREVVDRILGPALLEHAHLHVEEAARDVERAQALDQLAAPRVGDLLQVERGDEAFGVEGAVAVERGHEARAGEDADLERAPCAAALDRVVHLRAEEPVLAEHLAEVPVGLRERGLVGAGAAGDLVAVPEVADLVVEGRVGHEHRLGRGVWGVSPHRNRLGRWVWGAVRADEEDALCDGAWIARLDVEREDHAVGLVGVGGLGVHLRVGEPVALVEAAHARGDRRQVRRGELAAGRDLRRVERLRPVEHTAVDLHRIVDEPAREHVDAQHHAAPLGERLHGGARVLARAQRLAHQPPRRPGARRFARAHRPERERRRPAPAHGDHVDALDRLAREIGRGRLPQNPVRTRPGRDPLRSAAPRRRAWARPRAREERWRARLRWGGASTEPPARRAPLPPASPRRTP